MNYPFNRANEDNERIWEEMDRKITMSFNTYATAVSRTMNRSLQSSSNKLNYTLGLCGEAGEFADLIKKYTFHGHPTDFEKLKLELGDCLWYITALATEMGFSMDEIAQANIDKLMKRYPTGFSNKASKERTE